MIHYILRRLLLLPLTLFVIILVNFVILNLAPGEPTSTTNISATGEATRLADESGASGENQYLLFREHYGLTLPILWNNWPSISAQKVHQGLEQLVYSKEQMPLHKLHKLNTLWGDRARFIMPNLLKVASHSDNPIEIRKKAVNLFIRGGIRQGYVGAILKQHERTANRQISQNNTFLSALKSYDSDKLLQLEEKVLKLQDWFQEQGGVEAFHITGWQRIKTFFLETRFCRYLSRVLTLDFGTLRQDSNKTVISEVGKRIKYSMTLAVIPLVATFFLCQIFGMIMALNQNRWIDYILNISFLILFALPVFVVAPFLIEKFALNKTFPFTNIPIPYSGFHGPLEVYSNYTSLQRVGDIMLHLFLPLIAIKYGTLAVQARLSRTAFLETMKQDYVKMAKAKGLRPLTIWIKHIGRNGSITILTSLAASLGVILGGSLIVETIFEINGFGRFFYQAILNRDYNVILFSAFAGSLLSLLGYLAADIAYTFLDPRVSLE